MLRKSKKSKETKEKKEEKDIKLEKEREKDIKEKKEEIQEEDPESEEKKYEKPIILTAEAYKTIILYASRYANQAIPPEEWKEIYGILIGYTDDEFVYIERAEALTYGQATDVQLNTKHYIFIDEIQQKLDEEGKGYFMVGWWHSHPGLDLFFSDIDIYNQLAFQQNNPDFCGLVFDHTQLGKKKEEKIGDNILTKFETGFEIYRLNDVTMDINNPNFSNNYHRVDYIVDGLNKFFFANVLSELSALVAQGKPLQSAYGEDIELGSKYQDPEDVMKKKEEVAVQKEKIEEYSDNILHEIPISEDIVFNVDDFFYDEAEDKRRQEITKLKETAEQLIYEGNLAFKVKDAFAGIEKYRKGIDNYKKLQEFDRVFELLSHLAEHCISTEHQNLAEQLADELFDLASEYNNLFYKAESSYLQGYLLLKKVDNENLKIALTQIQNASVIYEDAEDFAGSGRCYYKIGTIYQARLNQPFNAGLFFVQAIRSLNMALIRPHPYRKSLWAKAETLTQKILELKDVVNDLIPNIENPQEREKVKKDLDSISFNF
ncbi:MAG: Mov34/MPN/PAD-1 family protein [Promethearchaeota archaeon]